MDLRSWALCALVATAALIVVAYLYRRRETPVRGRPILAALRWATLSTLILLLFDPELPAPELAAGAGRTRVLLDASLSMALPAGAEEPDTRWQQATAEAARLAGKDEVLLFGGTPRNVPAESLAAIEPSASASRLLPALQAASEAGIRRVIVLTDGGVEDAAEVGRILPRLGLDVEVKALGGAAAGHRALAEVEAPAWAEAGKPVDVRVGVVALGAAGDTATVVLRQGGRVLAQARLATPAPGRVAAAALRFTPEAPTGGGLIRYDVALQPGDVAPADNERSFYVFVGERPTGVALVSFRPDQEPRFLQPVLEQALGLTARGFLRAANGRYLRLGAGTEAGQSVSDADVQRAVGQAELVVLHGLGSDAPAWAREAARRAKRVLIFPAANAGDLGLPVSLPTAAPGEWYLAGDLPASPVAPLLAGVTLEELPPLLELRPVEPTGGAWTPLQASRARRGAGAPVVVAGEQGDRRWAVATADGFWRWAFRGGDARQAYRRLWAALGGWLVREERFLGGVAIRPLQRVAPRGEAVRWVAPALGADSIAIRLTTEDGAVALDTVVAPVRGDSLATRALSPGHYRYQARAFAGGHETVAAEGPLTVESYSPEFTRASVTLAGFDQGSDEVLRPGARPGTPLHATPWPYLLLVLLLAAEWVLRRRWGLR